MTPATDSASRFSRRQWRRRLRALRPLLLTALGVGLLVFAGWVVAFSSWLAADSVTVSGEDAVSDTQIMAVARVDLGTPLARLDLDAIHDRVAAMPEVAEVSVRRSWPHTIAIDVTERQPLAAVHRDGSWWVMDAEGVVFRETPKRDKALPVVEVRARVDDEALREVASVVTALPDDLLADVRRVTARSMDSISLRLRDHSEVKWGSAAQSDRKVQVLALLLDQVKAAVYDVSVPEQPTSSG
jgi:cell division protein FtsQ